MDSIYLRHEITHTEALLLLELVERRVGEIDAKLERLRRLSEEADAVFMFVEEMNTQQVMRMQYAAMARRLGQLLDVPFAEAVTA